MARFGGTPVKKPRFGGAPVATAAPPAPPQDLANNPVADNLSAGFTAGVDAIPIAGPTVLNTLEGWKSGLQNLLYGNEASPLYDPAFAKTTQADVHTKDAAQADAHPIAKIAGTVAGTALPFVVTAPESLAGQALGMSGKLLPRIAAGTISGSAISGADKLARGGSLEDAGQAAIEGGAIGGGLPLVGSVVKGVGRALKAPVATAPAAAVLKADAGVGYDAARATGIQFKPSVFSPLGTDLRAIATDAGAIMPDGKVASGYNRVKAALKATEQFGTGKGPVTIQQQAVLRKIIQNAAGSMDKTESRIGSKMVDAFDDYFDNLPDAAFVGNNAAGSSAMASIARARQAYAQAMRTQTFEDVITRAKRAGGTDAAYRSEFKSFLNSARKTRGFPPGQLAAVDKFVQGGPIAKLVGALSSSGSLPGAVAGGFAGGPVGAISGMVAAPALRAAAGRSAAGQAEALRTAISGTEPPSLVDLSLQRLYGVNDNPANLGPIPQTLAALANQGP